jgi:hypothetical protein
MSWPASSRIPREDGETSAIDVTSLVACLPPCDSSDESDHPDGAMATAARIVSCVLIAVRPVRLPELSVGMAMIAMHSW